MRLIDRIFHLEEINGGNRCPTYMFRWQLLRLGKNFAIYLHHFVGDDWALDQHDHPKRFVSIGLWGRYIEETPNGERTWRAPWIRSWPATHIHRLRLIDQKPCWTLVLVFKPVREWGFWQGAQWIPWEWYVKSRDSGKNC